MQLPDTLLRARAPAAAKAVLAALWSRAEGEPAWTGVRVADLAEQVGMGLRYVERLLVLLRARGAVRREARDVAARRVLGFGLCRSIAPLPTAPAKRPGATGQNGKSAVAKRDRAHKLTIQDDLRAIAQVASRGDGERRIATALIARAVPCSAGEWHHVKVHRRIDQMRLELGVEMVGAKAGDVVVRWRASAEATDRRRVTAVEAVTPAARIDFDTSDINDEQPRRKRA
jgi:hypothetical protein